MSELQYPADLRYTEDHEWVADKGEGVVRVGITAYAQDALGDVVYVSLPSVGDSVTAGESCGEVESTKSVSDIYGPLNGTVSAINDELESTPELVNSEPYGSGWLIEITVDDGAALDAQLGDMLDANGYRELIED